MDTDIQKLKEIIQLCRRNGLKSFEGCGYNLQFHEEFLRKPREEVQKSVQIDDEKELTDEEILLWSAVQLPPEA